MFYLFGKELSLANARAFHENPDRLYTAQIYYPLKRKFRSFFKCIYYKAYNMAGIIPH